MAAIAYPTRNWSVNYTLPGTTPATTTNFHGFWIAPVACIVKSVNARYGTVSSANETLMLKKVASATALSAGTDCLAAGIPVAVAGGGAAATNQAGTLHATPANYTLAAGDTLGFVASGTPTSLANFHAVVELAAV